jgi:lipopolysaccharide/colanic/teichoic acid biosynthesis glycosyltransferase
MKAILEMDTVPRLFSRLVMEFAQRDLFVRTTAIGGNVYNLCAEDEFLEFYRSQTMLDIVSEEPVNDGFSQPGEWGRMDTASSPQARLVGNVIIDKSATVDPGAIILGPSIIAESASVGKDAIVDSSIIGPGITVNAQQLVRNRIVTNTVTVEEIHAQSAKALHQKAAYHRLPKSIANKPSCFRLWPILSYARLIKRIGDIVAALIAIVLFLPLVPIITLAVKLSSPGSIFYKARRQGRYGKDFHCLKFRTMKLGADQIQEKLRMISEVDGPQFKIVDDPRITPVGRFLRDTYLDEIPQFYNVLLGQMSIVGPRPSPRSENIRCPLWRDARLSVRPGITGLWQINRTREPMQDFQEWIQYDTEYTRRLSFRLDIQICYRTFLQMLGKFAEKCLGAK